jgi:hypothetical protein
MALILPVIEIQIYDSFHGSPVRFMGRKREFFQGEVLTIYMSHNSVKKRNICPEISGGSLNTPKLKLKLKPTD